MLDQRAGPARWTSVPNKPAGQACWTRAPHKRVGRPRRTSLLDKRAGRACSAVDDRSGLNRSGLVHRTRPAMRLPQSGPRARSSDLMRSTKSSCGTSPLQERKVLRVPSARARPRRIAALPKGLRSEVSQRHAARSREPSPSNAKVFPRSPARLPQRTWDAQSSCSRGSRASCRAPRPVGWEPVCRRAAQADAEAQLHKRSNHSHPLRSLLLPEWKVTCFHVKHSGSRPA